MPGNHDRFDDNLTQDVLDGYYETFPYIKPNETVTHNVNGITVKFHLYDSSHRGGGFATGKIDDIDMVTKSCSPGALDVAILHHHLFPPPGYSDRFGDLENADDALAYFVACGFDAILVGHTHVSYFETFSIRSLGAVVTDSRRVGRIAKKIAQWSSWLEGERWFKVPTCADGKRPALSEYVEYLYIRNTLGRTMPEVKSFSSVRQFTAAVRSQNSGYRETTEGQRKRRTLLSMSPSAMQSEAAMKGFHILQFQFADTGELSSVSVEHHQYHKKQYTSFERQFPMVPS